MPSGDLVLNLKLMKHTYGGMAPDGFESDAHPTPKRYGPKASQLLIGNKLVCT